MPKLSLINKTLVTITLAFGIIVVFVIAAISFMEYQIRISHDYAKMINLSGKQRMLAQRIAFFASSVANDQTQSGNVKNLHELHKAIDLMQSHHMHCFIPIKP